MGHLPWWWLPTHPAWGQILRKHHHQKASASGLKITISKVLIIWDVITHHLSDSSRKASVAPESGLVRSEIMRVKRRAIVMTATIVVIEPRRVTIATTVAMTGR